MTYFVSIKLANVAKKSRASVTVVLFKVFSTVLCIGLKLAGLMVWMVWMILMVWITRRLAGDTGVVVSSPPDTLLLGGSKHNSIFVADATDSVRREKIMSSKGI